MSWGFRSLVTTKNDLKCATHFQGLCVCVFIWVRVIRISNVFWICRTWISPGASLFACLFVIRRWNGWKMPDGTQQEWWQFKMEWIWLTDNEWGDIFAHLKSKNDPIPPVVQSLQQTSTQLLDIRTARTWPHMGGILSCQCNGLKNANFCWIVLPYSFHSGLEMNINEPNHPPKATIHQGINFALSTLKGLRTTWPWGQGPKSMFFLTQNEGNGLKLRPQSPFYHPTPPSPKRRNLGAGTMDAIDSKSMQVHWAKMIGLFKPWGYSILTQPLWNSHKVWLKT